VSKDSDRYWDANAFLGWLAEEPNKVDRCRGVIRAAEAKRLRIVTSSLTMVEVVKLKGGQPVGKEAEPKITAFFEQPYVIVRQLDRRIAEFARRLIWDHNLGGNDAVHLATALVEKLRFFDTWDSGLVKLSGKLGTPPLTIGYPDVPEQLTIDDATKETPPAAETPS
jgi:predicted nucleic acid-binding protein